MSQSSGYQYQLFPDTTNSLKSGPPPMVNGQPSAMPHIQNGIQSPHLNPAGTPSSQSSRDQSREPSRDPSPTQYLHNQYRPQLPRPPMPTINGPQVSNRNPTTLPPRTVQTQQYSPTITPPPNVNVPVSNVTSSENSPGIPTMLRSSSASTQPFNRIVGSHPVISQSQIPPSSSSHNNSSDGSIGTVGYPPSPLGPSKLDITNSKQSLSSTLGSSRPVGPSSDFNDMSPASDKTNNATVIAQTTHPTTINQTLPTVSQSSGQVQPNVTSTSQFNQNQLSTLQVKSQHLSATDQNLLGLPPTTSTLNQFFQSSGQSQSSSQSINQPSHGSLSHASGPSRIQSQNVFGPANPPTVQSTSVYPSQPKLGSSQNLFGNVQSAQSNTQNVPITVHNSNMQNIFSSVPLSQQSSHNQSLTGPQSISSPQVQRPPQSTTQSQYSVQYPTQQNLFGSQPNISGLGSVPQQSQNIHSSQQNLASQKKYPQSPSYGVQQPPISISSPTLGPQRSGIGTGGPGQYQMRSLQPGMPISSEQQMHGQYDTRQQYPGQMSNVPLNNMTKRYPGSYPEQINELNSQMSGLSVSQAGFNKLWGIESIDLLQCRNILPPEKVEPPKIKLHQEILDNVNCNPECTLTKIPESNSLLQKSRLPLGILVHPFKDLYYLPVIQCSTIVRCRACRTYINPFIYFVDSKRWKCNLCYRVNELPEEFQFDPVTKTYGDPSRRPEVKNSTIEFIAPSEYMLRPPQPAVYLFILDISRLAVESGYLNIVCNTIADELSRVPGDGRTQIGFLAVDSTIHFYSMPDNVSQPHEMIMSDVDDVFLPCPDNLIVNLKEREELVRDLLAQLPTKYQGTHDTNNALGAGLQAAYKLISPTGGRISVFQTCLPNLGPGSLQPREDPNNRAGKDVPHLNPVTDFYKRLALDCSEQHIAVDLFLLNSQYSDLATLSGMCKFSGGCIYHMPLFRINKPQHGEILERILRRYLNRKVGFEAVMRVRCTRGLSIHTFHGNLFVRSTDLLSLPNVNPDAGFGMQVSIDESLSDVQSVCFQAALLYTSSKGERRIRVHTLCLPVATNLTDILHSADQQCIVGLLSKMAVDRSQQSSLSDARDALINVPVDVLSAYKLVQSAGTGGLLAPSNLKLLPLYIIALLKCIAFRSGTSTRLDDRVFTMCQLKTLPLGQLIQLIYPDLYPVHALDDRNCKDVEGKMCPQPPRLHLSAEKLDSRGAFLLDAGDRMFIYIGKNVHPTFCYNVLGVPAFTSIPEEIYELPELDTVESERLRNFVFSLQEEKPHYASLQIIRDDSHFRSLFTERLIEDRIESALSYYEFLQHLKNQLK